MLNLFQHAVMIAFFVYFAALASLQNNTFLLVFLSTSSQYISTKIGEIGRIYTHSEFDTPMYTPIISTFFLSPCFSTIGITRHTGQSLLVPVYWWSRNPTIVPPNRTPKIPAGLRVRTPVYRRRKRKPTFQHDIYRTYLMDF